MTERQKKDLATRYTQNYLAMKQSFSEIKYAAEHESFESLKWLMNSLSEQYHEFNGKFRMLYELGYGVMTDSKGTASEAVLVELNTLSTELITEFYENKIIIEER